MAANRIIRRGGVAFHLYEKSINVISLYGCSMIYLGREPEDADVDRLCDLLDIGATMQAEHFQDALKPRKMPRT